MPITPAKLTAVCLAALGLALGTTLAVAGPAAGPATPPGPATDICPVPDETKCLSKSVLHGAYLDSQCGKKHAAICKPFVEHGLENDPDFKSAPTAKMIRPGKTDLPEHLREGKRRAYRPKSEVRGKKATHLPARVGMTSPPPVKPPTVDEVKNTFRVPAWGTDGGKAGSCAEYAYKRYWDWSRFTDASAACKGDVRCIVDVAMLPVAPGIANRKLVRKDGTQLPAHLQIETAKNVALPKNLYFAVPTGFLDFAPGLDAAKKTRILAALNKGKEYYGLCSGTKCRAQVKVGSEWGFHEHMRAVTKDMSDAEFQEYDRRKGRLEHLVAQHFALMNMLKTPVSTAKVKLVKGWVSPLEQFANPVDRLLQLPAQFAEAAAQVKALNLDLPGMGELPGANQQQGAVDVERLRRTGETRPDALQIDGAATVLAAPTASATGKPTASHTCPNIGKGKIETLQAAGKAIVILQCHIGLELVREYERLQAGHKSCLDVGSTDCDWSPRMFIDEYVSAVPQLADEAADEEHCQAWTKDVLGPYKNKGVSKNASTSINAVDQYIAYKKAEMQALLADDKKEKAKLQSYALGKGAHGLKFGADLGETEVYGDKGMFAAGYDYMLGWGVEPSQLQGQEVCQLGGYARGGFGVDAWLVGADIEIVDGLGAAAYNGKLDGAGKGAFGNLGNGKAYAHAHLRVLGVDVFDEVNKEVDINYALAPEQWTNRIDLPPGYKPSFTIMAGPVPISGAVWAEFFYGASFGIESESNMACDVSKIDFVGRGVFTPQLGVDGRAQVGVGIAGLLSVGVRGALNLVTVGVPVTNELVATIKKVEHYDPVPSLKFTTKIGLSLATLSGWLSLYIEFLFFEEEFEILRWNGISTVIDLLPPVTANLRIAGMKD